MDHRWIHFFGWDENASWNFSPSARTWQTRKNIPRYVLFRWTFLWAFHRWRDNNDTDFTLSSSDLLKDLSSFKLENMAIRVILTGASEGWSAPGTASQGQSASSQSSRVSQLMIIHGVSWQVEVPSQQMSIEANDYYRALLYELLWEKGSQLQLDWRGSWGGLLYPAGCSQDRRKRERASDRSDSGVATEGVGVELGEMMVFCHLVRGAQIIPKAPAKTGKRGWLLIFWRVYRFHWAGDSDTMKRGVSYLAFTECCGNLIAHMHSYRWYMVVSDGLICHNWI